MAYLHRLSPVTLGRPRLLRTLAPALIALVLAALFLSDQPAAAQTPTSLVSNTGQTSDNSTTAVSLVAQGFGTGSHSGGYVVTAVEVESSDSDGDAFSLSLWEANSSGRPTTLHTAGFARPRSFAAGVLSFAAPPGTFLDPSTNYAVVITPVGSGVTFPLTSSDNQDTGGASGWSINDGGHVDNGGGEWNASVLAFQIRVKGEGVGQLVGNIGQTAAHTLTATQTAPIAQWFRSGGNAIITSVEVPDADSGDNSFDVSLWTAPGGSGLPVTKLHDFEPPDSFAGTGTRVFTAPTHTKVTGHPNSDFALVITPASSTSVSFSATSSGAEDSGGATNWLIGGDSAKLSGTTWALDTGKILRIRVNGHGGHPPDAPANPDARVSEAGKVRVEWTAPAAGTSTLGGYRIEVSTDAGSTWSRLAGASATTTRYTDNRASPYDDVRYRVFAFSERGMGLGTDPMTVDPMTVALTGNSGQTLGLIGVLDNDHAQAFTTGANVAGYTVKGVDIRLGDVQNVVPEFEVKIHEDSSGRPGAEVGTLTRATAVVDSVLNGWENRSGIDLAANTTYFLVIHGAGDSSNSPGQLPKTASDDEDSGGAAGWSIADTSFIKNQTAANWSLFNQKVVTVIRGFAKVVSLPAAPTALTAVSTGPTRINLSWTAPADDGGSTITGYKIEVSTDGSTWSNLVASQTATTYAHTGLTAGSTRHYRVSAINSVGAGAASDTAMETSDVYVSNTEQGNDGSVTLSSTDVGQAFTTGSHANGYTLTAFEVVSEDPEGDSFQGRIFAAGTDGFPESTQLANLVGPTGANAFAAGRIRLTPLFATVTLLPDTTYFVSLSKFGLGDIVLDATTSNSEDTGAPIGWSLADTAARRDSVAGWEALASGASIRMAVRVEARTTSLDATLRSLTVSPKDVNGFDPDQLRYAVGVASTVTTATVAAEQNHSAATFAITPTDADTSTSDVHDVSLSAGRNAVTVTVTAEDTSFTKAYTVSINRGVTTDYGWKASEDFDTLVAAGNTHPEGIWSDETTIWVVNGGLNDKIYAYRMSDKSRDSAKDFNTLFAAGNEDPQGIWSDGTTMWVADSGFNDKIYAYRMSDKSRDSAKDFNTLFAAGNRDPQGIWSDGTTNVGGQRRHQRQDLCLQDVGQEPRHGQGVRHPGRRGQRGPDGHLVRRHDDVGGRQRRQPDLRLQAVGQEPRFRQGLRHPDRRGQHGPDRHLVRRDDHVVAYSHSRNHKIFSYNHPVLPVSASATGTPLTINFNQPLGTASSLANSAFTVKKTPDGGSEETVTLSGSPVISGKTVKLTLSSAVAATDTNVKVSYTKPTSGSNNKLRDADNNEIATFTDLPVNVRSNNNAPTFASTTVTRSFDENTAGRPEHRRGGGCHRRRQRPADVHAGRDGRGLLRHSPRHRPDPDHLRRDLRPRGQVVLHGHRHRLRRYGHRHRHRHHHRQRRGRAALGPRRPERLRRLRQFDQPVGVLDRPVQHGQARHHRLRCAAPRLLQPHQRFRQRAAGRRDHLRHRHRPYRQHGVLRSGPRHQRRGRLRLERRQRRGRHECRRQRAGQEYRADRLLQPRHPRFRASFGATVHDGRQRSRLHPHQHPGRVKGPGGGRL